ncbi:hypothetical protein SAMN05660772_02250 [Pasteurella testudinis DSM 23072]|uniref:Uncharacterized protein n=1 Tax=Pasteurella testudinis DSM 23072 TaxID=1122938 RepID=A0A1W1UQB6_9PAST|nr:hypothetical protein SAMN05660772_02250 [Pasteurella testudinis DSM 23072]SUB50841.1 Uncharacterised protein [Pasteurella testudinis]
MTFSRQLSHKKSSDFTLFLKKSKFYRLRKANYRVEPHFQLQKACKCGQQLSKTAQSLYNANYS